MKALHKLWSAFAPGKSELTEHAAELYGEVCKVTLELNNVCCVKKPVSATFKFYVLFNNLCNNSTVAY